MDSEQREHTAEHHGFTAAFAGRSTARRSGAGPQAGQFAALTAREGVSPSYFTRLVCLSYLAPDITHAIIDRPQLRDLTAVKLLEHSCLPLAWHDQRTALGFACAPSELKNRRYRWAAHIIGGAVLEYGATEILPPVGPMSQDEKSPQTAA